MHRLLLFNASLLLAIATQSQTKLIAHKSRGGSMSDFRHALVNPENSLSNSNFGATPQRFIRTANLDEVIRISDRKTVMVTSEYCSDEYSVQAPEIWKAGADTVNDHPVFSGDYTVDEMKDILKRDYYFRNDIDKVPFKGFPKTPGPKSNPEKTGKSSNLVSNEKGIPVALSGTPVKIKKTITVHSTEIDFHLWDNDVVDGDSISLNVNGEWVLEHFMVSKEKKHVRIQLKPGEDNYLILLAHNEGSIPTNTTSVSVSDQFRKGSLLLQSSMKECEAIRLRYAPKSREESILPSSPTTDEHTPILFLFGLIITAVMGFAIVLFRSYRSSEQPAAA